MALPEYALSRFAVFRDMDPLQGYIGKRVLIRHMVLTIERTEVQGNEVYFFARREGSHSGCWLRLHQVLSGLQDDPPDEDNGGWHARPTS